MEYFKYPIKTAMNIIIIIFLLFSTSKVIKITTAMATQSNDWWQNAVFYQIYVRSFKDSNGDGIGDLRGVISKLDYLKETGIGAIWLSPIFKSPMVDFGYDISDFMAIQEEYGTMKDFEDLMLKAKLMDIKIILDFVPNHSSNQCEWFIKSESKVAGYEDFYVWSNGKINKQGQKEPPNNWQSVFYGSAWSWSEKRQQYYLHQFVAEQPDLNYRNSKVIAAMDKVLHYWLDKGVSGFRVDAVNHLFEQPELCDEPLSGKTQDKNSYDYTEHIYTKDLPEVLDMLQHWRKLLNTYSLQHNESSTRIMMTEAYAPLKSLMDYYEDDKGIAGAHIPFNFFFITDLADNSDARDFVYNIQKWLTYMPRSGNGSVGSQQNVANWVMGNHDIPRVATRFGTERVDAMNMLIMTLPGVAVTYNGEEIGMQDYRDISWSDTVDPAARNVGAEKYKTVSRDPERTPFQWDDSKNAGFSIADKTWLPLNPNYETLNLEQQQSANRSHYKVYKSLLELRKLAILRHGRIQLEVLNRQVFAFKRQLKGHGAIVTIINVGRKEQLVDMSALNEAMQAMKIVVAGTNSAYEKGHVFEKNELVPLLGFEGVVCMIEEQIL